MNVLDDLYCRVSFLPDNIYVRAGVNTLTVFLFLLAVGLVISGISSLISRILSMIIGSEASFVFCNYVTWPGTVHHEFSHALAAILTGAKVTRISLVPHGDMLGEVDFIARGGRILIGLQMTFISIAPIVCGMITESVLYTRVFPLCDSWWKYALLFYFAVSILLHMTLSRLDLENLSKGIVPSLVVFYGVFLFVEYAKYH
ncbi:MAG: M50 family metallopeptidase [Lachnospiraceae bacterium]|nr:M50 family metallopeptidase [Lachnospiraceae bacterium]